MANKPPRRNLPPEAEQWGRFVDDEVYRLRTELSSGLTNLGAAQQANASSLSRLSNLADSGWVQLPFSVGGVTTTRHKYRMVGGMVTITGEATGPFAVGQTLVGNGLVFPEAIKPEDNTFGDVFFTGGHYGLALITPNGDEYVYNQTGASRASVQYTLVYPAKYPYDIPVVPA